MSAVKFPEQLQVQVTGADITLGSRLTCRDCPISHAAYRAIKHRYAADVMGEELLFLSRRGRLMATYWLPDEARRFIQRFDTREDVVPFTFVAELAR